MKVASSWRYVHRALDECRQITDVYLSRRRNAAAARRFFHRALAATVIEPREVITDQAAAHLAVLKTS